MCRVRFGLTGIFFDSLEPSRPREEFCQPLIASIPPVAQKKQGRTIPEAIDGEEIEGKLVTPISDNDQDGTTKNLSDASLPTNDEEDCRLVKNAKPDQATVGSKRVRNSVSPSSSSPSSVSSLSPASSPPSSDEDQVQNSANGKSNVHAPKSINSQTTQERNNKHSKRHNSTTLGTPTKAPPAKRVRFAMDVQECSMSGDDAGCTSSSHSSDDSYTDPPSPTEPFDAFGGYYHTRGASRPHGLNAQTAGWKMWFPAEEETSIDDSDDFPISEDGSEVDVQGLPVKGSPPRTARAAATLDQRHHISTPPARPKDYGRIMDQSRLMAGGIESKVNKGLHQEESLSSQRQTVRLDRQLRYPKLRSGKDLPEPIFVVRPKFISDAKEKAKPADMLSRSGYSRSIPTNRHQGLKSTPARPAQVKASKTRKISQYRSPSVTDDLKRDAKFDEDLGLLIRDV